MVMKVSRSQHNASWVSSIKSTIWYKNIIEQKDEIASEGESFFQILNPYKSIGILGGEFLVFFVSQISGAKVLLSSVRLTLLFMAITECD